MQENGRLTIAIDRAFGALALLVMLIGAGICAQPECLPTADQAMIKQIIRGIENRQQATSKVARDFLGLSSSDPLRIALAAEAAAVAFEHEAAIDLYRRLPADGGRWEFIAAMGMARRCDVLKRYAEAERHLRRALDLNVNDDEANSRLGHLLQITGRSWEGQPCFFRLMRGGKCRGDELLAVAAVERFFRSDNLMESSVSEGSTDVLSKLSYARRILVENRQAEAEVLLREVVAIAPELGEAQGRLGRIIYDRDDSAGFLKWHANLPSASRNHPEVWFVLGMQARRTGQIDGATRCFIETLNLSPNHLGASVQIAGCLDQLRHADLAKVFARRASVLADLESQMNILRGSPEPELMKKVIKLMAELGRFWEAAGWSHVRTFLSETPKAEAQKDLRDWLRIAVASSQQTESSYNPVTRLRRSDFPEPQWSSEPPHDVSVPEIADKVAWEFQDDAKRVGIDFRYFEGTTEETRLQHIFNVVGGGLAAFDYDLDGWCDLYLAQANNWRDPALQGDFPDRLFQNRGERFRDVTTLAGVGDLGFSHGVCTGDFDQDGFPDIYIGNLGPNRLYHNNGDGTFTDWTVVADVAGDEWTTSSALVDFSGDGLPDLYVANYSKMEETAQKICRRSTGQEMACTPDVLAAEYHRLYLNLGDGTFRDITAESGMRQPNGRGLGLVAWDFAANARLGLFVANDTSANFLFINTGAGPDGVPRFREEAMVRGAAFDVDGNAQACMGVAAGDANHDGRIDMYITNFFGESDTLYSQRADGLFDDATRPYALRDPGFWTLGFGCQFIDFDGDGWEDLVATNGHVDQQSRRGDPDRTPPQLFRNLRGRKFEEIAPGELGPFFQKGYLGRGLAKLDWNRDGRVDFAVSHLHDPFALVTNNTAPKGASLVVRLVGRTGTREPIGALVKLRAAQQTLFRLVTGGDGYLVTNERAIHFSVPVTSQSVELEVRWPGGSVQRWDAIRPGQEIMVIEGRSSPLPLRTFDTTVDRPEIRRSSENKLE